MSNYSKENFWSYMVVLIKKQEHLEWSSSRSSSNSCSIDANFVSFLQSNTRSVAQNSILSWINQGGLIFVEWFPHYFKLLTCLTPTPSVPNLTGLTEPTLSWKIKIMIFFQIEISNCWYETNVKDKEGLIREIINLVTGDSYMWQPRRVPPICHYCHLEFFKICSHF